MCEERAATLQDAPDGVLLVRREVAVEVLSVEPDSVVEEARFKEDLDADFPDNPVLVGHVSMHGAVLNSAAMRMFGLTAAMLSPAMATMLAVVTTDAAVDHGTLQRALAHAVGESFDERAALFAKNSAELKTDFQLVASREDG